ncbi:MAG: hypothetical protein NVSMB44_29670 [Ktedonobacteraceae bacterium]
MLFSRMSRQGVISRFFLIFSLFAVALSACDTGSTKPAQPTPVASDPAIAPYLVNPSQEPNLSTDQTISALRQRVKYVFVIYQENRSFDSYFGTFPGADGLFSKPADQTPGFHQNIVNTDGTTARIQPFRIGPKEYAADTDDVDHSHSRLVAKMNVVNGNAQMDHFALTEEAKYAKTGKPSVMAKQFGELSMAYADCNTVPFLWRYANRFTLYDHMFQSLTGPSTPGNLAIIAAQAGQTQEALHPDQKYTDNGDKKPGAPVLNDNDPLWGSPADKTTDGKLPVNPKDFPGYGVADNQTYASLPLTLANKDVKSQTAADRNEQGDLSDVKNDIPFIANTDQAAVPWGWYEEGYSKEPTDPNQGPTDANGTHASYITHHNGPQYFGYIANNPQMSKNLHGLQDFFTAVDQKSLSSNGGVFYLKGGYKNIFGLKPADPDPKVQKNFVGDDDHPAYADAQISEALVAKEINAIANSSYWSQSAIVLTWDDSEGNYDHVPPPIISTGPDKSVINDGPRVPFMVISPYARAHYISHEQGDHGSVVKFVDTVFGLKPLADLPDEKKGRDLAQQQFGQSNYGPNDDLTPNVSNLVSAFDPARLSGKIAPLPASYATIPENTVGTLPQQSGFGCKDVGITPTDIQQNIANPIPADFNPRPKTNPTQA